MHSNGHQALQGGEGGRKLMNLLNLKLCFSLKFNVFSILNCKKLRNSHAKLKHGIQIQISLPIFHLQPSVPMMVGMLHLQPTEAEQ